MDQVGSHSPDGHEAMTTESLLKETEDGTEDETDEGVMDEQGIMRIKPSAVEESVQGQDKPWPATRTMSPLETKNQGQDKPWPATRTISLLETKDYRPARSNCDQEETTGQETEHPPPQIKCTNIPVQDQCQDVTQSHPSPAFQEGRGAHVHLW